MKKICSLLFTFLLFYQAVANISTSNTVCLQSNRKKITLLKEMRLRNDLVATNIVIDTLQSDQDFMRFLNAGSKLMLKHLRAVIKSSDISKENFTTFLKKEGRNLTFWKDPKNPSYDDWGKLQIPSVHEKNKWTLSQYLELSRLYAHVFEYFSKHRVLVPKDYAYIEKTNKRRISFRHHKNLGNDHFTKYRVRTNRDPFTHIIPELALELTDISKNSVTGIRRFKMSNSSTMKQISEFLGLPLGADISGTTADYLFFVAELHTLLQNRLQNAVVKDQRKEIGKLKENIQYLARHQNLISLAPISLVVDYHHSFLEVMSALSLEDRINYIPGIRASIINKGRKQAGDKLQMKLLDKLEKLDKSHGQAVFFHDNDKEFAIVIPKSDTKSLAVYKNLFVISANTYYNFTHLDSNMDGALQKNEVSKFIATFGKLPPCVGSDE